MRSRRTRVRFPPPPRGGVLERERSVFPKPPLEGGGEAEVLACHPWNANSRPWGRLFDVSSNACGASRGSQPDAGAPELAPSEPVTTSGGSSRGEVPWTERRRHRPTSPCAAWPESQGRVGRSRAREGPGAGAWPEMIAAAPH